MIFDLFKCEFLFIVKTSFFIWLLLIFQKYLFMFSYFFDKLFDFFFILIMFRRFIKLIIVWIFVIEVWSDVFPNMFVNCINKYCTFIFVLFLILLSYKFFVCFLCYKRFVTFNFINQRLFLENIDMGTVVYVMLQGRFIDVVFLLLMNADIDIFHHSVHIPSVISTLNSFIFCSFDEIYSIE